MIEAAGGTLVSEAAIRNTGLIEVTGGALTVNAAVTGAGSAVIGGGTLTFAAAFDEAVTFTGAAGALALGRSRGSPTRSPAFRRPAAHRSTWKTSASRAPTRRRSREPRPAEP